MKKVAVLIKDVEQQYEGLRLSLGALLDQMDIKMFVIDHKIGNMDEAYFDNMEFLDEIKGERFSNNDANVEKYGFQRATVGEMGAKLKDIDLIIPF
ncbi:hypothetical protein QUF75_01705 [Desulfococcaceae bacterium HSG7]|nr:hypothetical protein [Desulfococcaceae bacterium HSG9]MDM8553428.1 hypothetical protein [Desulfococcaceae bacterium HSG7]